MICFKVISSSLLIFNLFVAVTCCKTVFDNLFTQYTKSNCDCSDNFDPNGNQKMNDFFKCQGKCLDYFTPVEDKVGNMDFLSIKTYIRLHYATTYVYNRITNRRDETVNADFSMSIPESALISNFLLELDGKIYKSMVLKRTDPPGRSQYQEESRNFHISIELQPNSTANFHLIYEEFLQRHKHSYELNLHLHPGRLTGYLEAEIYIDEEQPIVTSFIRRKISTSVTKDKQISRNLDRQTTVRRINSHSAIIQLELNEMQQKKLMKTLQKKAKNGLDLWFSVHYDVQIESTGGTFLTDGCHFAHFFTPDYVPPLPKHVIFVLDRSGSMRGKRVSQLINAMEQILPELRQNDLLSLIQFGGTVKVDDIANEEGFINFINPKKFHDYEHFEEHFQNISIPAAVAATKKNIAIATKDVKALETGGGTNLIGALLMALLIMKRTQKLSPNQYKPVILMITDADPTVGITSHDRIIELVTAYNTNASIFCLSLGKDADFQFLKKLAALNRGTAQYIAVDYVSKQLQRFYHQISTPLLNNIEFKYGADTFQTTNTFFPTYFKGTELVVAGKINGSTIVPYVTAYTSIGKQDFIPQFVKSSYSLDRLWAYLKITQNIDSMADNIVPQHFLQSTLNIALKYSFTTQLTTLSFTKPNGKVVSDKTMLKPAYQSCCDLYLVPVDIIKAEIRQIKFPIQLSTSPEFFEKILTLVNYLMNLLR